MDGKSTRRESLIGVENENDPNVSSSDTEELPDIDEGETVREDKSVASTSAAPNQRLIQKKAKPKKKHVTSKNIPVTIARAPSSSNSAKKSTKADTVTTATEQSQNKPDQMPQNTTIVSDDDDNSDLEMDLVQLSRRGTVSRGPQVLHEVTLSDEDVEANNGHGEGEGSTSGTSTNPTPSKYGFRKRAAKVNYSDLLDGDSDDEGDNSKRFKQKGKNDVLQVCQLSEKKLLQYSKNSSCIDDQTKWVLNLTQKVPEEASFLQFFQKCGTQVEHLSYVKPANLQYERTLTSLLVYTPLLTKFTYRYTTREGVTETLKAIKSCVVKGHLKSLKSLVLVSLQGDSILTSDHIQLLIDTGITFEHLELGDALWEDIKPTLFEKLLENIKSSLQSLTIHGGFKGDTEKSRFINKFPRMPDLKSICICPKYGFISERKNPQSKKSRLVRLDKIVEEPFRFAIQFMSDMPKLEKVIVGNLVDIEELPFSILRKLKTFKCGSNWNLSVRFPSEGSRQSLMGSAITELQLPDALKDPSFIPKVAQFFPYLKKVWIYLPSVPVLRAFFKSMENSKLEELYLKTQFDFESTMESCILPNDSDALKRSPLTQTQLDTLKEYKHFEEYVRYHNIELPLEPGDLMDGHSAGIRALKSLKVLELEHIPRILLIPNPDEERKWFDYNCKFLSNTFGFERYPFSGKCHKEILKMNLDKYTWKNLQISHSSRNQFDEAGYITVNENEVFKSQREAYEDEEDIFIPIAKKGSVNVNIQPSMLLADYFKDKQENG